jgi:hypothetical protein
MLLLGVAAFNSFHIAEKLRMLQVLKEFHAAQSNNDKETINRLLSDDFTETGARHFVQTPEVIDKKQLLNIDYSKFQFQVEAKYLLPANIFGNRGDSISFVREYVLIENGRQYVVGGYFVTYTFDEGSDGLKISKIVRNL